MKTFSPKPQDIEHKWYVVDADGAILGRLAARIAHVLRGKHKPIFAPHIDCGDFVVVLNADKVRLTGRKTDQKVYYHHSGYPGGFKVVPFERMLAKRPEFILRNAVRGMLPKNRLGRKMLKKLKVYLSDEHPHKAQRPEPLEL
ncbi:50S ribosomal protein L13 [candidate division KSB1 bacterium RBG_16_48_16]|nr:MAG: 50S ribosomal protein L13 [candidate division KSB1 bacterium RBG_16_48_16]